MSVVKASLVAFKEEFGNYIVYVFRNLENLSNEDKYIMCTRLPNWQTKDINLGDIGFLSYKYITAGEDSWYNSETNEYIPYKYSNNYFINFIPIIDKQDIII